MPVEDHKQAARRFYEEVINARNLDALDELLTPDGVDHTFGSQSAEQAKQFFGMVPQPFPDLHVEVHDVIAEGELVAARVTYTGTHQGEFVGIPATGKQTTTNGVDFFRMQDGRQAEHWGGPDMFSLLMQLGVLPGPGVPGRGTPPSSGRQQVTAPMLGEGNRIGRDRRTAVSRLCSSGARPAKSWTATVVITCDGAFRPDRDGERRSVGQRRSPWRTLLASETPTGLPDTRAPPGQSPC